MEDVDLAHAKDRLEELIQRATRGEDVRITAPGGARVRLLAVESVPRASNEDRPKRVPGRRKGRLHIPEDAFEPMSEEELKLWYGQGG